MEGKAPQSMTARIVDSNRRLLAQGVFGEYTFQDRCEKDSNFWLPDGSSSEIRVLWKQGNPFVGVPLRVLEVSQHSSGLCLAEVALFIRLHGEQPSSSHILFRFDLLHVIEIKKKVIIHSAL